MKLRITLCLLFITLITNAQITIENTTDTLYYIELNSFDGIDCLSHTTVCYCPIAPGTSTISIPPGHKAMVIALYTEDDEYLGAETAPFVPFACTFINDPESRIEWLGVSNLRISD
jgi:hypothetical protein